MEMPLDRWKEFVELCKQDLEYQKGEMEVVYENVLEFVEKSKKWRK